MVGGRFHDVVKPVFVFRQITVQTIQFGAGQLHQGYKARQQFLAAAVIGTEQGYHLPVQFHGTLEALAVAAFSQQQQAQQLLPALLQPFHHAVGQGSVGNVFTDQLFDLAAYLLQFVFAFSGLSDALGVLTCFPLGTAD